MNVEAQKEGKWHIGHLKRVVQSVLRKANWDESSFDAEIDGLVKNIRETWKINDGCYEIWKQGSGKDFVELYVSVDLVEPGKVEGWIYVHWHLS